MPPLASTMQYILSRTLQGFMPPLASTTLQGIHSYKE